MSLSIGIVGLPNVGKSTLFNILTKGNILAANYPFTTIEPNTGIVTVPDERLAKLAAIYKSQKIIPAIIKFIDIAGLVSGASKGEGLGNKFLANIRDCQVIVHVVRAFNSKDVIHITDEINPKSDIEIINTELILADLDTLENRISKLMREAKSDTKVLVQIETLKQLKTDLESGQLINQNQALNIELIQDMNLLTAKPVIYLFNLSEDDLTNSDKIAGLNTLTVGSPAVFVAIKLEDELKSLADEEADELLESYGIKESGLNQLVKAAYKLLGLQSFLTTGPDETRAWTIKEGSTAPQAAGQIHTDFERGFIAAQIIDYNDLVLYGSESKAKEAGKVRTEGRDYIMKPNDVVEFRFNV